MRKSVEMKKKIVSIMLCMLMVVGLVPMMPEVMKAETAVEGTDYMVTTDANDVKTYTVYTEAGLLAWNAYAQNNLNTNLILGADITLTDKGEEPNWTPVGTLSNQYTGTVDGQGYTISGMKIRGETYLGFIGIAKGESKIQNLILENVDIEGNADYSQCIGGIAGSCRYVYNCRVLSGKIKGDDKVGGIAGTGHASIVACYNAAEVEGVNEVGGILGYGEGVYVCGNQGNVSGTKSVGGIVGMLSVAYSKTVTASWTISTNEKDNQGATVSSKDGVGYIANLNTSIVKSKVFTSGGATTDDILELNNQITECSSVYNGLYKWSLGTSRYPELTCTNHSYKYRAHEEYEYAMYAYCSNICDEEICIVMHPMTEAYDGAPKNASIKGLDGSAISVPEGFVFNPVYTDVNGNTMVEAPVTVGVYGVKFTHEGITISSQITIQPKEATSYAAPTPNTLTYNGEAQNLISAGTVEDSGFHMEYSLDGTNYSTTIPTATDAGTYTVYSKAVGADNTNYKTLEFDPIIVEIKKAPISIEEVTVGTTQKIYDGKNAVEITEAVISGAIDSESVSINLSKLTGKLSSANAGIYNTVIIGGLDAEGLLTGADAENYQIKVPSGEVNLSSPVTIERAPIEVNSHTIVKRYVYTVDTTENIDVTEFLPEDCGEIAVSQLDISGDFTLTEDGVVFENDTLTYTICKGEIGKTGTINFTLLSENYGTVYVTLDIVLVDKFEVIAADNVTLKNSTLYVGEALSKLEFNSVKFMANGQEIEGTLAWKDASKVPATGTTMAEWVFTPKDTDRYATLKGTIAIAVYEAPHIQGEDGKQGWDVVRDTVADAKEGDTVTVDMNGTLVVAGDVIEDIKGKDITIVFDMGDGIHWTVNGKDVTAENIADINMGVFISTPEFPFNAIPVTVLNAVTGENSHVEINLAHNGEFGFTAVLSINLEAKNAGLFAKLYYFNPTKQTLEFICADEIAADGTTELTFTHASDYAIVIDEVAADAEEQEGSANQGGSVTPGGVQAPQTGDVSNVTLWILFLMAGLGMLVFVQKKYVR